MIPKRIIFPFRHPEDWGQANKWEKWWKHPPGSSIIWNPPLETVKTYFCDFVWWNLPRPDLPRTCAGCQDHLRDGMEQPQDPAELWQLELWCKRHRFEPALPLQCKNVLQVVCFQIVDPSTYSMKTSALILLNDLLFANLMINHTEKLFFFVSCPVSCYLSSMKSWLIIFR